MKRKNFHARKDQRRDEAKERNKQPTKSKPGIRRLVKDGKKTAKEILDLYFDPVTKTTKLSEDIHRWLTGRKFKKPQTPKKKQRKNDKCNLCCGSGYVLVAVAPEKETKVCWKCKGKGKVTHGKAKKKKSKKTTRKTRHQ